MTDDEVDAVIEIAMDELQRKQDTLASAYGFWSFASFWFDQPSGTLALRDGAARAGVLAKVVPVGTHSTKSNTWLWGWANESLLPEFRARAQPLRDVHELIETPAIGEPVFNIPVDMPWQLTALAVQRLGALGAYKVPGDGSDLYLAVVDVTKSAPA